MDLSGRFTPPSIYNWGNTTCTPRIGRQVGPQSQLDALVNFEDQEIEVCVLKLISTFFSVCIMAVYRAPTGNFNLFLNRLDDIIKTLY